MRKGKKIFQKKTQTNEIISEKFRRNIKLYIHIFLILSYWEDILPIDNINYTYFCNIFE